jgi:excisionase family DNA binding protein
MNEKTISFNEVPEAISEVLRRICRIEEIISAPSVQAQGEEILNAQQAADLLHITLPTLYNKVRKLPRYRNGKRWLFKKSELMEYLNSGRTKTSEEQEEVVSDRVDNLLSKAVKSRKNKRS